MNYFNVSYFITGARPVFFAAALALVMSAGCSNEDGPVNPNNNDNGGNIRNPDSSAWIDGGTLAYAGQNYRTIIVGETIWMAENLNYETPRSWCNDNKSSNCETYGRLYAWDAAMSACAAFGWRLPDSADWDNLAAAAGGRSAAGRALKSAAGWKFDGNGIDSLGFSALPGGNRSTDGPNGSFWFPGVDGLWWSAAEAGSGHAIYRGMSHDTDEGLWEERRPVEFGLSVRCVRPLAIAISNPYANVDWGAWRQYKAALHTHSKDSDGSNTRAEMLEDYYEKGFGVVTMNDHDFLTTAWDGPGIGALTAERRLEMEAGEGRGGNGMITIGNTNEHSAWGDAFPFNNHHINAFDAPFLVNDLSDRTMAGVLAKTEELGGISHINHPGRYTGGMAGGASGANASNNAGYIAKYVGLFMAYESCTGMEIVNSFDNESRSDRILWDNILKQTMPQGRFVWGFSNDDSHRTFNSGFAFNVMLMDELSPQAVLNAMRTGAFYAVSRVDNRENIKIASAGTSAESLAAWLKQPTPSITAVTVTGGAISIAGADYDVIEWIADGIKISAGNTTLNIKDHLKGINSYVRAQIKSSTGIAYTQPFGVSF